MTTATETRPKVSYDLMDAHELQHAIRNWQPKKLLLGQDVRYYPNGVRDTNLRRLTAIFISPDGRTCTLADARTSRGCVRHVDDPFFLEYPGVRRETGTWDYTELWIRDEKRYQNILERLERLELKGKIKDSEIKELEEGDSVDEMRAYVAELFPSDYLPGVEGKMSRPQLRKRLRELEARQKDN